jgi:ABC-2 type transport system ATP-binding protein
MPSADVRASNDRGSATTDRPQPGERAIAIELIELTKIYPGQHRDAARTAAVDHINLRVREGQVFGLLGPNGAGKSTIIRMIATLLEPTSGQIRVCGMDARTQQREVRQELGVALGGERSVYWKLTARQNLEFFAALHGKSRRRSRTRIREVLEQMDLAERADDHIESYSTGMRQRLVIARALLHHPRVLLLDEPANGLDPRAAQTLHDHILRLRNAGHTIVLTTHDMGEAEALSDRLGIIDGGRLVAEGTAAELKRTVQATQVLHARLRPPSDDALAALIADIDPVARTTVERDEAVASLTVLGRFDDDLVSLLIAAAGRHRIAVLRVENEAVSLKDVFLTLTGRRLSAEPAEE